MKKTNGIKSCKKICAFILSMMMLASAFPTALAISPEELKSQDASFEAYSMKEIEAILMEYMNENYPDIELCTDAFYDFVIQQLLGDRDEVLEHHEKYTLIHAYLVEYKLLYEDYLLCESLIKKNDLAIQKVSKEIMAENDSIVYDKLKKEVSFDLSDSFESQTIGDIKTRNEEQEAEIAENGMESNAITLAPMAVSGYNGSKAATYAIRYALSPYNYPQYPHYSKVPVINFGGTDCTNFVSQCLVAGGLSMKGSTSAAGTTDTISNWYCKMFIKEGSQGVPIYSYGLTTSWIRVSAFDMYMRNTRGIKSTICTTLSSLNSNCAKGDPILLLDKTTNSPYHAIIISTKSSSVSGTKFCGHNTDRIDKPISDYLKEKSDNFRVLKVAS